MVKFKKKKKSNKIFPPRICKFFYLRSIENRSHIRISNLWRQRARERIRVSVNRVSIGEVGRTWVSRSYANAPRFFSVVSSFNRARTVYYIKGGGGNSLGIKLCDMLEFVKTIPPWRKRETRHYKNAKNENEKPSTKKKKKKKENRNEKKKERMT